ncbi:unnamed protein product [Amoebophrya sp. A25]|nr:unnamed protein product [Amoebophrya sp. A25]|eukprot:GSA25T00011887001.1
MLMGSGAGAPAQEDEDELDLAALQRYAEGCMESEPYTLEELYGHERKQQKLADFVENKLQHFCTDNAMAQEIPERVRSLMPNVTRYVNVLDDEQEREMEQEIEDERHTQQAKPPQPAPTRISAGLTELNRRLSRGQCFDFEKEPIEHEFAPLRDVFLVCPVSSSEDRPFFPCRRIFVTKGFLTTIDAHQPLFELLQRERNREGQQALDRSMGATSHDAVALSPATGQAPSATLLPMKTPEFVLRFATKPGEEALLLVSNFEAETVLRNSRNLRLFCAISRMDQRGDVLTDRIPSQPTFIVPAREDLADANAASASSSSSARGRDASRISSTNAVIRSGRSKVAARVKSSFEDVPSRGQQQQSGPPLLSHEGLHLMSQSESLDLTHLVPLHAFAGSLYADNELHHGLLTSLMQYFGLVRRDHNRFQAWAEPRDTRVAPLVLKDGFVPPGKARSNESERELVKYKHCEYQTSPVSWLRRFYSQARHLQTELSTSPLGSVLQCNIASE